jgi:hypothetical protein
MENFEEIKKALCRYYRLENEKDCRAEQGCYLNGRWLSIKNVIEIIEQICD